MHPYRVPELRRPTLPLGSARARRLKLLGAFALVLVNVALFAWFYAGGGASVFFLGPTAFAGLLVAQARSGSLVLHPEERAGEVILRRALRTKRTRFAYSELAGTKASPIVFMGKPADAELRLTLSGGRAIALHRGPPREIEDAKSALDAFLADNDLPQRLDR